MKRLFTVLVNCIFAVAPLVLFAANIAVATGRVRTAIGLICGNLLVALLAFPVSLIVDLVLSLALHADKDDGAMSELITTVGRGTRTVLQCIFMGVMLAIQLRVAPF